MEPNNDLADLREMSASQLDALLRYDSPPETPNQPTQMLLSDNLLSNNNNNRNEGASEIDVGKRIIQFNCNNEDGPKIDSLMEFNREPVNSQLATQFDFSIFHDAVDDFNDITQSWHLSATKTQTNILDDSVIISTPEINHITLDNTELPDVSKLLDGNLLDDSKPRDDGQNMRENDLEFDILDNIDFEQLSCLEQAYFDKVDISKSFQRQCQTQVQNETVLKLNDRVIASCPAPDIETSSINCCSTHATNLSQFEEYADLSIPSRTGNSYLELNTYVSPNVIDNDITTTKADSNALEFIASPAENIAKENNQTGSNTDVPSNNQNQSTAPANSQCLGNTTADTSAMPSSVKQLFDVVKAQYSDFAFIYALSAQLCQDRIPMECFVTLKMALLLSLASIGHNPNCPPIPIIAIGNDTYMTDYLMTNVGQLGTRFVGPTDDSKAPSSNGYRNHNWIEADPILLAKGGVYYVGDWSRLKLRRSDKLFKDIECSNVAIDRSPQQYPLETAIWAHWRSFKYNAKDQQMFNKFVKIFGIPIFVSDDNHDILVNYTLEQASIRVFESTVDHLSINSEEMREFLVKVSQRNVDFTPEAHMLLQKYFVASRTARQDCLTKQAYVMLKQFAESFAKLSFRHDVLTIDALSAIVLCEHSIENIFGTSDNPPPHFGALPFVGAVDEYVVDFQQWLDSYIQKYTK